MKKTFIYGTIAALAIAYVQPAMASDSDDVATVDTALDSSFVEGGELEAVSSLDLETALSRAIDDSGNLELLELKYKALNQKQQDLEKTADDLDTADIPNYALPEDSATNIIVNGLMTGMGGIIEGMNSLILSNRNQAEVAAAQMKNNKENTELDQAEAKEGIALQTIGAYIQLLAQKEQMQLLKDYIVVLEGDVAKAQALQNAGMSSDDDIEQLERQIEAQQDSLATTTKNYQLGIAKLSYDLGISYNPDLVLEPIDFTVPATVERVDTETILAQSFELKRLYNNINQAEWEKVNTDTSTNYGKSYLNTSVDLAEQQAEQTKIDLSKSIESLYTEADNAYSAYAAAARILEEQQSDYEDMKLRFDYGLISEHDLKDLAFQVQQYATKAEVARLQAFALSRQVEAMERGLIQS